MLDFHTDADTDISPAFSHKSIVKDNSRLSIAEIQWELHDIEGASYIEGGVQAAEDHQAHSTTLPAMF